MAWGSGGSPGGDREAPQPGLTTHMGRGPRPAVLALGVPPTLAPLLLLAVACAPINLNGETGETTDSAAGTGGEPPACGLAEGTWSLTVAGEDALCMGGLETATGASVDVECLSPDEHLARVSWDGDGTGYALTCTADQLEVRCAFGGIDLTATLTEPGTAFSGSWTSMQCSDVWSGAWVQ